MSAVYAVDNGTRFTPRSERKGCGGSVYERWDLMRAEAGSGIPALRGIFPISPPLGGRRILIVPVSVKREFREFQGRLALAFPDVCWEADASDFAATTEHTGFRRTI